MKPDPAPAARPWKGVIFHCCGVYGRVYQDLRTGEWKGNCPRCARPTVLAALLLCLLALLLFPSHGHAQDSAGVGIFIQPGIQFLGFDDRERFQTALDSQYTRYRAAAGADSLDVTKQDFQKVNFCFPISMGLQWHINERHAIAAGAGYFYDRESVVLSETEGKLHELTYTLQGVPAFVEYRLGISPNLISLREFSQFSVLARWYWFLPGTEIYSTWGRVRAQPELLGNGWGLSLGYHIGSWKRLSLFGDLGFTSLKVSSRGSWSEIVPESNPGKARWEMGGIQLQIRASFGAFR